MVKGSFALRLYFFQAAKHTVADFSLNMFDHGQFCRFSNRKFFFLVFWWYSFEVHGFVIELCDSHDIFSIIQYFFLDKYLFWTLLRLCYSINWFQSVHEGIPIDPSNGSRYSMFTSVLHYLHLNSFFPLWAFWLLICL